MHGNIPLLIVSLSSLRWLIKLPSENTAHCWVPVVEAVDNLQRFSNGQLFAPVRKQGLSSTSKGSVKGNVNSL